MNELYLALDGIKRRNPEVEKNRKKSDGRKFTLRLVHLLCYMDSKRRVSTGQREFLEDTPQKFWRDLSVKDSKGYVIQNLLV